jgi:putative transposase
MPTQGRAVYDGAVCHIIQRGNNRQRIFREAGDYWRLLHFISKYKSKYEFDVYNYCIMSNHLHLLIRIPHGKDLPKIMQGIFQSFRFYYRKKYKYTGYLFQGRYKSKVIETDAYLLECARYIERNPLRAGIVEDLSQYKWSTYPYYAYGLKNDIITANSMYTTLGDTSVDSQKAYREYVTINRIYEDIVDRGFKINS